MGTEDAGKSGGVIAVEEQRQQYYGTFQGVANYPSAPSLPRQHHPGEGGVVGLPQPSPPPGATPYHYHSLPYQSVPGYALAEWRPYDERRLPCCGIGTGWFLFFSGFFLGAIPWYIGAFLLLCARVDYREKPGLVACTLAAVLAMIAVSLGVTKATQAW